MSKLVTGLRAAMEAVGLRDGMTISFHHHLRNGDKVLNLVLEEAARMGVSGLTVNASSLFDVHAPLIEHMKSGVVKKLMASYISAAVGRAISEGILAEPVEFRTHGGRACDIVAGRTPIDIAFIGASRSDPLGNCTGRAGKSACGSLGYAFADALCAEKVVVVTDELAGYPLDTPSISEDRVDLVVLVDSIGDAAGIVSGTTRITRDPVGLAMARMAARVIESSGLLKEGFSFQTGAGGATLAAAMFLKERMLEQRIQGSFAMGGITGYLVDMLREGLFTSLLDVQCFDLKAVQSLREDPRHHEISAIRYASPEAKSCVVNSLDVVLLGATEIDLDFNVNVHTDSGGYIMGGSGGHSDTAAGAKVAIILAPLSRARLPIVRDRVQCVSTPGKTVDVLVTQRGVAVNPNNPALLERLKQAKLPVTEIRELKETAERLTGVPAAATAAGRTVAKVIYRDGSLLDTIRAVD